MDGTAFSGLLAVGVASFCKIPALMASHLGGLLVLMQDLGGSQVVADAVS